MSSNSSSEIARGSVDAEHIHQLRVGLRRLRAVVREMAPYVSGLPADWEPPVRRVFEALGSVRDRQVFMSSLAGELRAAGAPIVDREPADAAAPIESLGAVVRSAAFHSSLLRLLAFADDGDTGLAPSASHDRPLDRLRKRLSRLQRRVARDAGDFETLGFDGQHRARKRLKRLRYVAAFLAPLYPPRDVEAWLEAVKPAQAALGRHIDLLTAARRFEAEAPAHPAAWFAVGWLRREARDSARASRKRLRRLAQAKVFW